MIMYAAEPGLLKAGIMKKTRHSLGWNSTLLLAELSWPLAFTVGMIIQIPGYGCVICAHVIIPFSFLQHLGLCGMYRNHGPNCSLDHPKV